MKNAIFVFLLSFLFSCKDNPKGLIEPASFSDQTKKNIDSLALIQRIDTVPVTAFFIDSDSLKEKKLTSLKLWVCGFATTRDSVPKSWPVNTVWNQLYVLDENLKPAKLKKEPKEVEYGHKN